MKIFYFIYFNNKMSSSKLMYYLLKDKTHSKSKNSFSFFFCTNFETHYIFFTNFYRYRLELLTLENSFITWWYKSIFNETLCNCLRKKILCPSEITFILNHFSVGKSFFIRVITSFYDNMKLLRN